jgi:biopolymer transport protein TolR
MQLQGSSKRLLSEINVTPLVDVMLVMLIIFMVTAPMMKHGIDVNLPQTTAKPIKSDEERLIITVRKDGRVFIDDIETPLGTLGEKLQHIFSNRTNKEAFLRADAGIPYGRVVEVMAEIKRAGVNKLGMVTEPVEKKR